jgi:hypothetical protein
MPRHTDPRLLHELKAVWAEYGCALCGQAGPMVELHHVWKRSQGGPDYRHNIIGLCGELSECKAHWLVTVNRARIVCVGRELVQHPGTSRDWGLLWDGKTSGRVPLRIEPSYEVDQPSAELVASGESWVEVKPSAYGGEDLATATPTRTPEERFAFLGGLYRDAENRRVACAVMLAWVEDHGEHLELGYSTILEYAVECGISKADAVKMVLAGQTFGSRWAELTPADRQSLSLERLYYGGRLVRDHGYDVDDALHATIGNTTAGLVALVNGDEPAQLCVCPVCQKSHYPITVGSRRARG